MIIDTTDKFPSSKKVALTNAQRKAKSRAKRKAQEEGTYVSSNLEKAKQKIIDEKIQDINTLLQGDIFTQLFEEHEVRQLKIFIQNQKSKLKKEQEAQSIKEQQQIDVKEKAQRLGNQQLPQLHQSLLQPCSFLERSDLIKKLIEENLFLFLEYMESYASPTQDFLKIILDLCKQFDDETSTILFVRVCKLHKGEYLFINEQMASQAMQFLIENKIDNIASFGLLRMIFLNNISLSQFSIKLLQEFQTQYEQTILNFYRAIPLLKFQVIESLPPTCFCFTIPLLNALKAGGDILHTQIPYQFLPYVIEIICYSFNNEESSFLKFLQVFKLGCKRLYDILLQNDFYKLLQEISQKTKSMVPNFFKTLNHISDILDKAFQLLTEKKIELFDDETINFLINDNEEQFQLVLQRPKVIKESSQKNLLDLIYYIQKSNCEILFDQKILEQQLSNQQQDAFKAMGISNLLPIQQICFQYCVQQNLEGKHFIQFDTGQGKTSLCLGIAIHFTTQGQRSFIINKSKDLSFRDFKKANNIKNKLKTSIGFFYEDNNQNYQDFDIAFLTFDSFLHFCSNANDNEISQINCIFDEYDSIFFQQDNDLRFFLLKLQHFNKILCFSGSLIEQYHKDFVKNHLTGQIINFSLNKSLKPEAICISKNVYSTKKEFKDVIKNLCFNQVKMTPIVLILNEFFKEIKNTLVSNGIQVEFLIEAEAQKTESALQFFTQKQKSEYQVYMINENQGRGLDFCSNKEIEANGGVFVIIACLPYNFLQFNQFIGRTSRIQNKGQYAIVLFDKETKNSDGEIYVNKKLVEIKNNDLLIINDLIHKLNQNQFREESKNIFDNDKQVVQDLQYTFEDRNENSQQQQNEFQFKKQQLEEIIIKQNVINELTKGTNLLRQQTFLPSNSQNETKSKKRLQKEGDKKEERQSKRLQEKSDNKKLIDQGYFDGYSNPKIHEEMVNDHSRMKCYEQAINLLAQDKVVIDVGAGTGILSMIAAKAGAKKVFAIEQSQIASICSKTIKDNSLQNKITVIQGLAEEVQLPIKKADLIVSEWMGYFLIFENMLPSVVSVREKYLKKGGQMIPSRSRIYLAAIQRQSKLNGFDLSSVHKSFTTQARIDICSVQELMSEATVINDIDLLLENVQSSYFENEFDMKVTSSGQLNGFVGWFTVDLTEDILLSTSPFEEATHWKQTIFLLNKDYEIQQDEQIKGKVFVTQQKDNYRALQIQISFKTEKMQKPHSQVFSLD